MRGISRDSSFALIAFVLFSAPVAASEWPQWLGEKRDAVWEEKGLITKFPKDGPPVVWRKPIGEGYAGPAVTGGRIYIMDRVKTAADPKNPQPKGTALGHASAFTVSTPRTATRSGPTATIAPTSASPTPPDRERLPSWTATGSTRSARWATSSA